MTGYTQRLVDENLSFENFVLLSARAFNALSHMREESLCSKIKLREESSYYKELAENAEKELAEFIALNKSELIKSLQKEEDENFPIEIEDYNKRLQKAKDENTKLQETLEKVKKWKIPTDDYKNLKNYMIEQIEKSFNDLSYFKKPKKKIISEQYITEKIDFLTKNIEKYNKKYKEEIEKISKNNKWITDLSLNIGIEIPET